MRPLLEYEAEIDENRDLSSKDESETVRAALAWHDGDAQATIATLLADCAHLKRQLDLTRAAMSRGFVRGWEPATQRE